MIVHDIYKYWAFPKRTPSTSPHCAVHKRHNQHQSGNSLCTIKMLALSWIHLNKQMSEFPVYRISYESCACCIMLHLIAAVCAFTPTFSDPWMSFWYLEFQSWLCSALTVLYNLQLRTGPQVLRAPQQQLFEEPRLARCKWLFAVHKFTAGP